MTGKVKGSGRGRPLHTGSFLASLRDSVLLFSGYPRLAPWAAFCRRSAAGAWVCLKAYPDTNLRRSKQRTGVSAPCPQGLKPYRFAMLYAALKAPLFHGCAGGRFELKIKIKDNVNGSGRGRPLHTGNAKSSGRGRPLHTTSPARSLFRPWRDSVPPFLLTQDLRPFDFAQGRLWAIVGRPSGAGAW